MNEEFPKVLKCSVILGLMKAIVQMSIEHEITDWLAVMEPSLLRMLGRFELHFTPLGSLVDYHGMRQPCCANISGTLDLVRVKQPDLWEFATGPLHVVQQARLKLDPNCEPYPPIPAGIISDPRTRGSV